MKITIAGIGYVCISNAVLHNLLMLRNNSVFDYFYFYSLFLLFIEGIGQFNRFE